MYCSLDRKPSGAYSEGGRGGRAPPQRDFGGGDAPPWIFSVLRERESREHHINRKTDGEKEKLQKCIIIMKNKSPPSALSPSSLFFNPRRCAAAIPNDKIIKIFSDRKPRRLEMERLEDIGSSNSHFFNQFLILFDYCYFQENRFKRNWPGSSTPSFTKKDFNVI